MVYAPFTWTVVVWKQLGKKLGFPTANIIHAPDDLTTWTYKINIEYDSILYHGVWTYFAEQSLFEAHIFGFNKDIYGEDITVYPLFKIRDNKSFKSIDALVEQIERDVLRAYQHPWTVLTFGTFDYFHPWHAYYLNEAKKYGDRLVTIIARDSTVERVKGIAPKHNEYERKQCVAESWICELVVLGDKESYYSCLSDFAPNVVCLWYDQHSFDEWIAEYCNQQWISTDIVRLPAFEPERRKSSLMKQKGYS